MALLFYPGILFTGILPTGHLKKSTVPALFKELDPILHSQLRLAEMSLLISVKETEFTFIREKTNSTAGNPRAQTQKLKDAAYIIVIKQFKQNYPQKKCKITKVRHKASEEKVANLAS